MRALYANYSGKWYYLPGDKATPTEDTIVVTTSDIVANGKSTKYCIKDENLIYKLCLSDVYDNELTNRELYEQLKATCKEFPDTKIVTLFPEYQMVVRYTVLDKTTKRSNIATPIVATSEQMIVQPVFIDMGCLSDSETVHRVGKRFKARIRVGTNNSVAMGIMRTRESSYSITINEVCIYQSTNMMGNSQIEANNRHYSSCNNGYSESYFYRDNAFNYSAELIYSSKDHGIELAPTKLTKKPNVICFDIDVTIMSHVIGYNKSELNNYIYIKEGDEDIGSNPPSGDDIWYHHCCHHIHNGHKDCHHCHDYDHCCDPDKTPETPNPPVGDDEDLVGRYTMHFAGDVELYEDLPKSGMNPGDVYNILYGEEAGANYLWNGLKWDKLSDTEPIDNYVMEDELDPLTRQDIKDIMDAVELKI